MTRKIAPKPDHSFDNLSLISALGNTRGDLTRLPPYLRTLLVADGTVSRSLEAYFWEPIDVIQIKQGEQSCVTAIDALNLEAGESALYRSVELRGRNTGILYSRADSIIKARELPENWRRELMSGRLGIGTLISDSGMESYREIMHYDLGSSADKPTEVSRSYRIFLRAEPIIYITEYFPLAAYGG